MLRPNHQNASALIMVEPNYFDFNQETATNNFFQKKDPKLSQSKAMDEFQKMVQILRDHSIRVDVFPSLKPLPDAVFLNNWFSTHSDGRVFLYPMKAQNRQKERRTDIFTSLEEKGFYVKEIIDFSESEQQGKALEGTGSLIFDHTYQKAFASLSERTDPELAQKICRLLGYELFLFDAYDPKGRPVYHTNVLLSIGRHHAVICSESIPDRLQRKKILEALSNKPKVIDISFDQMFKFCGNILQVTNQMSEPYVLMSQSAFYGFSETQKKELEQQGKILAFDLDTIETTGGGSARCMLAENFLPRLS